MLNLNYDDIQRFERRVRSLGAGFALFLMTSGCVVYAQTLTV
jgi:hypothetical protein